MYLEDVSGRIKPYLDYLVGCQQSAFVPNRNIFDNILLMQELSRVIIGVTELLVMRSKLILKKLIYDSVEWGLIENVLRAMGFPLHMINWLMTCITTPATLCLLMGT